MTRRTLVGLAAAIALAAGTSAAHAQVGTAITYQGQLKSSGTVVNNNVDLKFTLWDAPTGGTQQGPVVDKIAQSVSDGLFTTNIDFGVNPYTADAARWLQIEVRNPAGSGAYIPLASRQKFTPAPFSLATRGMNVDATGKVGIGMVIPSFKLDVNGSGRFSSDSDYALRSTRSDGTGIGVITTSFATYIESLSEKTLALNASPTVNGASIWISPTANRVGFGNGNSTPLEVVDVKGNMLLRTGGRLYFGPENENTDPVYLQRFSGGSDLSIFELVLGDNPDANKDSFYISTRSQGGGSQNVRFVFNSDGNAFKAGTQPGWGTISDQRVKHDIKDLSGGLDRLLSLHGKTFYYNDPNAIGAAPGLRTGFIAQEVETVFPEWVGSMNDGTKTLTIGGGAFEATTVEAIRELRAEKDAQIAELAAENAEMQARLARLEAVIAGLTANAQSVAK